MKNHFPPSKILQSQSLLTITVLLILGIGVFFRFYHLDQKVYWQDEAATSLRGRLKSYFECKKAHSV